MYILKYILDATIIMYKIKGSLIKKFKSTYKNSL